MKKKIALAVAILAVACNFGFAQNYMLEQRQADGFFAMQSEASRDVTGEAWGVMPAMIAHGLTENQNANAPLGSGLLLLAGMGLAYGMRNRK